MSCTEGTGKDVFLDKLQTTVSQVMGKQLVTLTLKYDSYDKVIKWL